MEPGSKNAEMADSEDVPGPHVPPAAGAGNGIRTMVAAATRYEMATTRHETLTTPTPLMAQIVREEQQQKGSARGRVVCPAGGEGTSTTEIGCRSRVVPSQR